MLPDRVSNPGPLTYESGALPIALRGRLISTSLARGVRDMSHANRTVECLNNQSRTKGDCRPQTASPHPFRFLPPPPPPPPPPHTHKHHTHPCNFIASFPNAHPAFNHLSHTHPSNFIAGRPKDPPPPTHTPVVILLSAFSCI